MSCACTHTHRNICVPPCTTRAPTHLHHVIPILTQSLRNDSIPAQIPAWKAELEYLEKDGLTQDDQLLKAATQEDAHELPWFAGAHVLPLYPGTDAK